MGSTPDAYAILDQVRAELAKINGLGVYHHDVSGIDQVQIGAFAEPPRVPFVSVSLTRATSSDSEGTPLGMWTRTLEISIIGWVAATADTAADRTREAVRLLDDIMRALEANVSLNDGTRDLVHTMDIDGVAFDGDLEGAWAAGFGIAAAVLTVSYRMTTGA